MSNSLHHLTPRPPLGWNSYDSFGCFINERRALENLRVFVERLKPHGYEYFVLDAGWYRQYDLAGREFPGKDDLYTVRYDAFGRPVPAPSFFPETSQRGTGEAPTWHGHLARSQAGERGYGLEARATTNGIQRLAEACHAAGVKFGIHMMRGIPRAAVEANTQVQGTAFHARDLANSADTCDWCADNFGVDMRKPGAQAYYDSIVELLAGWGVDFIKYDDIVPSPPEVDAVVAAIGKSPRDIVLSLSPGNGHNPDGWPTYFKANMIRTSGDIWDEREDFRWVFERWQAFMDFKLPPGCWLDMDMIPFGELQVWNPATGEQVGHILMNGKGSRRMSSLNSPQKRTFMTMRALAASPLMMGGNLPGTDEESFALLTDPEMLACNQNGVTGKLMTYTDWTSTWLTPHRTAPDSGWFGIFNRDGNRSREIIVDPTVLGIPPQSRIHDIWNRRDLGRLTKPITLTLAPDEVLFGRFHHE
jgi:alpha-galactosidase